VGVYYTYMASQIAVGIDVGSSSVRVVVCEYVKHLELLAIRALVSKPSRGLRHGYIIHGDEVVRSIHEAVREAETMAETRIKRTFLSVGGTSLGTSIGHGTVVISRPDNEVVESDVTRVTSESEESDNGKSNYKIIHTIPLEYKLDGKKMPSRPVGYHGSRLETKTLFITAHNTHLQNLVKAVEKAGIEVEDIIASPVAESVVTLSPLQKSVGCILTNIGSETVSVITFEEGIPVALQVFPIGSSDITSDIALGFRVPLENAEELKLTTEHERGTKKKIDEIVEARLSDIFELIELHLKKLGRNGLLPAGIVLTGAASHLPNITNLAKKYLNLPARIGINTIIPEQFKFPEIKKVTGIDSKRMERWRRHASLVESPEWSVAFGLCIIALDMEKDESLGVRLLAQTKGRFMMWIKQFLP